jgi:hypothetical protein
VQFKEKEGWRLGSHICTIVWVHTRWETVAMIGGLPKHNGLPIMSVFESLRPIICYVTWQKGIKVINQVLKIERLSWISCMAIFISRRRKWKRRN